MFGLLRGGGGGDGQEATGPVPALNRCLTVQRFRDGFWTYVCRDLGMMFWGTICLFGSAWILYGGEGELCAADRALDRLGYSEVECDSSSYVPLRLIHLTGCDVHLLRHGNGTTASRHFLENLPSEVLARGVRARVQIRRENKWAGFDGGFLEGLQSTVVRVGGRFRLSGGLDVGWTKVELQLAEWQRRSEGERQPYRFNETLSSANTRLFTRENIMYTSDCKCGDKPIDPESCSCPPDGTVRIWFEAPDETVSVLAQASEGAGGDTELSSMGVHQGYVQSVGMVWEGSHSGLDMAKANEVVVHGIAKSVRVLATTGMVQGAQWLLFPDSCWWIPCFFCNLCERRFLSTVFRASVAALPWAYLVYLSGQRACSSGSTAGVVSLAATFCGLVAAVVLLCSGGLLARCLPEAPRSAASPDQSPVVAGDSSGSDEERPVDTDVSETCFRACFHRDENAHYPPLYIIAMQMAIVVIMFTLAMLVVQQMFTGYHSGAIRVG